MIGSALKKLAVQNGMKIDDGVAYGALKGCFVALSEGAGYKRMCIYLGCYHQSDDERPTREGEIPEHLQVANAVADLIIEEAGDFKTYRLMTSQHRLPGVSITQGGSAIQLNFFDNPGTMKCIQAFVDNILPQIAPYTEPHVCTKCGLKNDDTTQPVLLTGEVVAPMHAACAAQVIEGFSRHEKTGAGNTFFGVIGALIGSLIGAALWAVIGIAGYIASLAGLAAAFLSGKGYELLGGRPGKAKVITLIVCVILAVVLGTIATEVYWLHDIYQEELANLKPYEELTISEAQFIGETIPMLWTDPEVLPDFLADVGLGLLFAALGCFRLLRNSSGNSGPKVRVLKG